jgi:hypothetical protein
MSVSSSFFYCVLVSLVWLIPQPLLSVSSQDTAFLIDDFLQDNQLSALGTAWRSFSDRVMGGRSLGQHRFQELDGKPCLRLTGDISLDNNGGFIQVALALDKGGRSFDASSYQGIRVSVRGNNSRYYIHLRSRQSQRPWQYYAAEFPATEEWRTIEIPFSDFKPEGLRETLNTSALLRIAVVAAWQEFTADVAISRLEFYR